MAFFGALITFLITATAVAVLGTMAERRAERVRARLRDLVATANVDQPSKPEASTVREDMMPTVTKLIGGRKLADKLYLELSSAGLPIRPSEFMGIIAGSVIMSQILAAFVLKSIIGYLMFGIIAVSIPILILRYLQRKRRVAFDSQIVDGLVLMASSLRSGFSFLRAVQMVAQEMPAPISQEFSRVISEANVGRSLEDALRSVVNRVKSYDFDLVVTAVLIQHQVGGNLADILDTIAGTIRERVRVIGEMRALTAEGRLSGIILVLLPIGMAAILSVINPTYMSTLITDPIGPYLIGTAIIAQIIGGYVINKMLVLDI